MGKIPSITAKRLHKAVPKFKKILKDAIREDINEANTVTIIVDMMEEVFGFDKYKDISRELSIKNNSRCDLAVQGDKNIDYLIEVKSIGTELTNQHLKQVVNYASAEAVKYVVLTNGVHWKIYSVEVAGSVTSTEMTEFDFTELDLRKLDDQEKLFLLCKRGVKGGGLQDYKERSAIINPYTIAAILQADSGIKAICSSLRKMKKGLKVSDQEIRDLITDKVIKRDLIESDKAKEFKKKANRMLRKSAPPKSRSASAPKEQSAIEASNNN